VPDSTHSRVDAVVPSASLVGARITVHGRGLAPSSEGLPVVRVGGVPAQVVLASASRIGVMVPASIARGRHVVTVDGAEGGAELDVGTPVVGGVHQVDSPAFGPDGDLYATFSGTRGQRVPVSVFRIAGDGDKTPFLVDVTNATSMACDRAGVLHVTSRYDGTVRKVRADGSADIVAHDLGVACGLAFGSDGTMFVGDRSGTVFRVGSSAHVVPFVSLPPSLAAFHLAMGPDDALYVTGPTMATYDHVYRIDRQGTVSVVSSEFGRPQGLAVDAAGTLYVVDALAGGAGLYRVRPGSRRELAVAATALVGVAFDPRGGLVVASNDTLYRLDNGLKPWRA
jgi:DNA-binding beta-propeller fold protein YncE